MDNVWSFLLEFFKVLVDGVVGIFYVSEEAKSQGGIFGGIIEMFNFDKYISLFNTWQEKGNPTVGDWIIVVIAIVLVVAVLLGLIILLLLIF